VKFLLSIVILFALSIGSIHAEVPLSAGLSLYEAYVDNLFQTSDPYSDYVTLINLDASFDLGLSTSVLYDSDFNLFNEYSGLHNQTHHLSIDHEKVISDGQGTLYFGGGIGLHDGTSEYAYYDYRSAGAYTKLKYYLTETSFLQSEYQIGYEDHHSYRDYSSLNNYAAIQISKSFPTRTTAQARLEAGRRDYMNFDDNPNATILTVIIRIAQSLTDLTGLQLQYRWHNAPKSTPYFTDSYYNIESPDDEHSYSGTEWQLALKHYTIWNIMLKGTLTRDKRSYNTSIVSNYERNDTSITALLEFDKKISINSLLQNASIHIQYLYKSTESSDPYYQSNTSILSLGTRASF